jgi:hypothetical protein
VAILYSHSQWRISEVVVCSVDIGAVLVETLNDSEVTIPCSYAQWVITATQWVIVAITIDFGASFNQILNNGEVTVLCSVAKRIAVPL